MKPLQIDIQPNYFNLLKFVLLQCVWVPILDYAIECVVRRLVARNLAKTGFSTLERRERFLHRYSGGFFLPEGSPRADGNAQLRSTCWRPVLRAFVCVFVTAVYLSLNGALELGTGSENVIVPVRKQLFVVDDTKSGMGSSYRRLKKAMRYCMETRERNVTVKLPKLQQNETSNKFHEYKDFTVAQCGRAVSAPPDESVWDGKSGIIKFSNLCIGLENILGEDCASPPRRAFENSNHRDVIAGNLTIRIDIRFYLDRIRKLPYGETRSMIRTKKGNAVCPQIRKGAWLGLYSKELFNRVEGGETNYTAGQRDDEILLAIGLGKNVTYGFADKWHFDNTSSGASWLSITMLSYTWATAKVDSEFEFKEVVDGTIFQPFQVLQAELRFGDTAMFYDYGFEEMVMMTVAQMGFYGNATKQMVTVDAKSVLVSTVSVWAAIVLVATTVAAIGIAITIKFCLRKIPFKAPVSAHKLLGCWMSEREFQNQADPSVESSRIVGISIERTDLGAVRFRPGLKEKSSARY